MSSSWYEAINKSTRAVLPVHLFGQTVDMEELVNIAKQHSLYVIEDAAQALGASFKHKKLGNWGDLACFSFFPSKNLGCFGDAGLITCRHQEITKKLLSLRNHGSTTRYHYDYWGYNARMDTLQAVVLLEKLKYLDEWLTKRKDNALFYRDSLKDIKQIQLTKEVSGGEHTYNQFSFCVSERDKLKQYLLENDIPTMIYYPTPLHLQSVMKKFNYKEGSFPVAEKVSKSILSLPIYPFLTREKQTYIVDKIKKFFNKNG